MKDWQLLILVLMIYALGTGTGFLVEHQSRQTWQKLATDAATQADDSMRGWTEALAASKRCMGQLEESLDYNVQCRQHLEKCVEILARGNR